MLLFHCLLDNRGRGIYMEENMGRLMPSTVFMLKILLINIRNSRV